MGPVTFLVIAVVVALLGIAVVVVMNRSPRRPDSAMEEFRREMQALAPQPPLGERQPTPGEGDGPRVGTDTDPDGR